MLDTVTKTAGQTKITVLNPVGFPPKIPRKSAAARLDTLDGKTIYLVDCRFDDSIELLKQVQAWFTSNMPSVKTKLGSRLRSTHRRTISRARMRRSTLLDPAAQSSFTGSGPSGKKKRVCLHVPNGARAAPSHCRSCKAAIRAASRTDESASSSAATTASRAAS